MKILIVCSGNTGYISPFIKEQGDAIASLSNEVDYYSIEGKGIFGYLNNYFPLRRKIKQLKPDILHAHYGLSGLLATLQFKVPVIVTYHNGEILNKKINLLSSLSVLLNKYSIYVAEHIRKKMYIKTKKKYQFIPCGIDLNTNIVIDKNEALSRMSLDKTKINILFGGAINNERKNYKLAASALEILSKEYNNLKLIELKGYNRSKVVLLLNACDLALLPSKSEGSPQFIKEAMACNCPIVATDVGDVKEVIGNTDGCYLTSFDSLALADKIKLAFEFVRVKGKTNGRERVIELGLDSDTVVKKIISIYQNVLNQ
ncbi:MAG: glycosyltransferase [Bacteroidetes bacterium]|nr:glycosyltransferase [Bacteroidota bacterium]